MIKSSEIGRKKNLKKEYTSLFQNKTYKLFHLVQSELDTRYF